MKVGIISDTHDQTERVKKAVDFFNREGVELVIHCGDIISPFTLQFYKKLKCPIKFLLGNNTGDIMRHIEYAKNFGLRDYEFKTFLYIKAGKKRIAAYHGDNREITAALIKCGDYDCVFSGHDHIAKIENRGKVLFVNPGTLTDKHKEGMKPPSIAIYDSNKHVARIINL
jgi:putative phosphoesterase